MKAKPLILGAALILGCFGLATASHAAAFGNAKPATKTATADTAKKTVHEMTGTVSSITDSELVLTHKWKGQEHETKFTLNSATKKDMTVEKGNQVTVLYQYENHQRTATELKPVEKKTTPEKKS
jgi:hypothetical protein